MQPLDPSHRPLLDDFQRDAGLVRVVLIVSPTCDVCVTGATIAGADLLAAVPNPDLRLYFAWIPVLPPDNLDEAKAIAATIPDPRAAHYWDAGRALGRRMGEALGISAQESIGVSGGHGLAWDVYLAYARGDADVWRPDFWMHKLAVQHAPRLDGAGFRRRVERLLEGQASA
ncbi:MAG: hypothetical protein WD379_10160 [Dehalococcoidia bacterium]